MKTNDRKVKVIDRKVVTPEGSWTTLEDVTIEYRKGENDPETFTRQVLVQGDAVAVLPFNLSTRKVMMVEQFRAPVLVAGTPSRSMNEDMGPGFITEVCAGMIDKLDDGSYEDPKDTVIREAEEEMGLKLPDRDRVILVGVYHASPGILTHKIHLYLAPYTDDMKVEGAGGGLDEEHEDIIIHEIGFDDVFRMAKFGDIVDMKSVILVKDLKEHIRDTENMHVLGMTGLV